MGFLKEKVWGLWGARGGVNLLFFWAVASGFQDVSQDNGLGKGWPVPQYRKVSLTIGHYGWSQMSIA